MAIGGKELIAYADFVLSRQIVSKICDNTKYLPKMKTLFHKLNFEHLSNNVFQYMLIYNCMSRYTKSAQPIEFAIIPTTFMTSVT